jgi:hypothetical protein
MGNAAVALAAAARSKPDAGITHSAGRHRIKQPSTPLLPHLAPLPWSLSATHRSKIPQEIE